MRFVKYHGLGNDYIVIDSRDLSVPLKPEVVQRICHRNLGPGSDGIVLVEGESAAGFIVRIFNPDGSEAENSGNGMRIVSRYLFDTKRVGTEPFKLLVRGERELTAQIKDPQLAIKVDMGRASFLSSVIPALGMNREILGETLQVLDEEVQINCVSVGNPHCVVVGRPDITDGAKRLGPFIEVHEIFPKRTNVQFVKVLDRVNIRIEIWERGAGYTLASGSSASAAACVCHKLGLVDSEVSVTMPGGRLAISIGPDFDVSLTGPVAKVLEGVIDPESFSWGRDEVVDMRGFQVRDLIAPELISIANQQLLERASVASVLIRGVASDSRLVNPGDLFFAVHGAKHDARLMINDAFDRGARAVVYEGELPIKPDGLVIPVADIRRALSFAAHSVNRMPSLDLINIGVTGTSGKTSVSWILAHALNLLSFKTFLGGTLGYGVLQEGAPQLGLKEFGNTTVDPLSVHELLRESVKLGAKASVFEATSQGVVQRRLRDVAWDGVIFTNLSHDHLDLHGTMEAYEAAKRELFTTDLAKSPKARRFAVINIDDSAGERLAKTLREGYPEIRVLSISLDNQSGGDYYISNLRSSSAGLEFNLTGSGGVIQISSKFIGNHNAYNLGCAALALSALGYSPREISDVLAKVPLVPGRLEPIPGFNIPVFVDYAHKPDALQKVLEFLKPLCPNGRLISVFGCGGDRDSVKRPIMGEISHRLADLTVITSDNPRSEEPESILNDILKGVSAPRSDKIYLEVDRRKAIEYAITNAKEGDIVLIAGKGHEPYQEILGVKHPFNDLQVARETLMRLSQRAA